MDRELDKARAAGAVRQSTDRNFGLVMAVFFLILAMISAWRHGLALSWRWPLLSFLFCAFALVLPKALHPLNLAWTLLGRLLHLVVSPLVMGLLYFGFFTPFGYFFRLVKGDPLRLKIDPAAESYWIERDGKDQPGSGMANQF